jgi:hypothetical protein
MTWDQNIYIRCGWHPLYKEADNRVRAHYDTFSNEDIRVTNSLFYDSSSADQLRSGGLVEGNIFSLSDNLLNCSWQGGPEGLNEAVRFNGWWAKVKSNVFIEARTNWTGHASLGNTVSMALFARGRFGIFQDNILADDTDASSVGIGLRINSLESAQVTEGRVLNNGTNNVLVDNNVFHDVNRMFQLNLLELSGGAAMTGPLLNITISNNIFSGVTHPTLAHTQLCETDVEQNESINGVTVDITWSGNTYYHATTAETSTANFLSKSVPMNFASWKTATGEDGSWTDPSFTDTTRRLHTWYSASAGLGLTASGVAKYGVDATGTYSNLASAIATDTITVHGTTYTAVSNATIHACNEGSSSWSGGTFTYVIDGGGTHNLAIGDSVRVTEFNESALNGVKTITAGTESSTTQFEYASNDPTTITGSGQANDFQRFDISSGVGATIADDIVASTASDPDTMCGFAESGGNLLVTAPAGAGATGNNIVATASGGGARITQPSGGTLGSGSDGDHQLMFIEMVKQSRGDWKERRRPEVIRDWIREGFNKSALLTANKHYALSAGGVFYLVQAG